MNTHYSRYVSTVVCSIGLAIGPVYAEVIDDMSSANWTEQSSWAAGTQPEALVTGEERVDFECRYVVPTTDSTRCVWEKSFSKDLSTYNAFRVKLELDANALEHLYGITYYFKFPTENTLAPQWHGTSETTKPLAVGVQESIIPFAYLRSTSCPSAAPALCNKIDSLDPLSLVWLSPYRKTGDTSTFKITLDSIEAINVPVALIKGDSVAYTNAIAQTLKRYNIPYFEVDKERLAPTRTAALSPLHGAKIVIANVVTLSNDQGEFVADFLDDTGARLIGFGPELLGNPAVQPSPLATALGVGAMAPGGELFGVSALQFTSAASGLNLPSRVPAVYSSLWPWSAWSSSTPTTTATVLANWVTTDNSGGSSTVRTSHAAWTLNTVGAYRDRYLANVYHPTDNDHVLLALMMQLRSDMETEILTGVEANLDRFAEIPSPYTYAYLLEALELALEAQEDSGSKSDALGYLAEAERLYTRTASTSLERLSDLMESRRNAELAIAEVMHPYSHEEADEFKATWINNPWGAFPGDWDKSIAKVEEFGFNHVVVGVADAGSIAYPSTTLACTSNPPVLPCFEKDVQWQAHITAAGSPVPADLEDPLGAAISEAHDKGIKFIAWKKAFSWSSTSEARRTLLKSAEYAQYEYNKWTNTYSFINAATPCKQEVRLMNEDFVEDVAENYDVDGIQLDFIRFNSEYASYDASCRAGFASYLASVGTPAPSYCDNSIKPIDQWAEYVNGEVSTRPACVAAYRAYLKKVVTDHVHDIALIIDGVNTAHAGTGKPTIELSAAVYPVGNEAVSQDWPAWAAAGDIQRAFPMTYSTTLAAYETEVGGARAKITAIPTFPLHFGLGGYQTTSDILLAQIQFLRGDENRAGFSFFEFNRDSLENMLPQIAGAIAFRDIDGNGIHDDEDHCVAAENPLLTNINGNTIADKCEHGLTASYFNDSDTNSSGTITALDDKLIAPAVLQRIDANVDMSLASLVSPGSGVNADYFSARWTGRIKMPNYTGTYTFCLKGDDGYRLLVNGVDLFGYDHWEPQDSVHDCATINLTAGQVVPIEVEFFDLLEEAILQLTWSWPGQAEVVVPNSALYAE